MSDTVLAILLIIVAAALYFLPTIIAANRGLLNAGSILIVNMFFGWTLLGWVCALAWSVAGSALKTRDA